MEPEPSPINTDNISLPDELLKLTELLAANVHYHWAQQRRADGWRYGDKRNDETKESPLLVSYDKLSQEEKEYDRVTAAETVKAILALGFQVNPPKVSPPPDTPDEIPPEFESWRSFRSVHQLLSARRSLQEKKVADPRAYRILASQLLRVGEPLIAYDVACDGLKFSNGDLRLQQLQALALARSGATESANGIMADLWNSGNTDAETLGILARTHKDLWLMLCEKCTGVEHLREAHRLYLKGYETARSRDDIDGSIYNGINAASMAFFLDDKAKAITLAEEVSALCERLAPPNYWSRATKAEAMLVRGDLKAAEQLYSEAAAQSEEASGEIGVARKQARLLLDKLGEDPGSLDHCFPVSAIRIVRTASGMSRAARQFDEIRRQIEDAIASEGRHFVYACVLSYPDLAVVEAYLNRGNEVHAVLPVSLDDAAMAIEHGVSPDRPSAILERCASVLVASPLRQTSSRVNKRYAELLRDGSALLHAQALDESWSTVDLVPDRQGVRLVPAQIMPFRPDAVAAMQETTESNPERIRAILFADAVNFSRLSEDQLQLFSRHFLGAIADVTSRSLHKPMTRNTWGDGLHFVFQTLSDAGQFALELRDRISSTDWEKVGLPNDLNLRIALHAGPVFEITDPITQQKNFMGVHVSRGARIEPITPAGQVYASENFAAIAAAQRITDFRCEYVGRLPLAKGYGSFGTYHVTGRECGTVLVTPSK